MITYNKENLYIEKRNDRILILNRETGRWYVGDNYDIHESKYKLNDYLSLDDFNPTQKEFLFKLSEDEILTTDCTAVIERPLFDKLNLLILDMTNKCNLACKYCSVNASNQGVYMTYETAIKALNRAFEYDLCADILTIEFSGGEPLMNFNLIKEFVPEAIETATKNNKKVNFTIQTNGTLLESNIIDFLIKYDIEIGVSIDGSEFIHDSNRIYTNGNGTYKIIIDKINLLKSLGGHVSSLSVICNPEQYDSVIDFAQENDIDTIRTNLVTKVGRANDGTEFELDYNSLSEKFINITDKVLNKELNILDATLVYHLYNLLLVQPHMCFRNPCGAGKNQIHVTATGDMYPCQDWRSINDESIGNVYTKSFKSAFDSSNRVTQLNISSFEGSNLCKVCNWKNFCGVCPREIYSLSGELTTEVALCTFYKKVFNELIWRFDTHSSRIYEILS